MEVFTMQHFHMKKTSLNLEKILENPREKITVRGIIISICKREKVFKNCSSTKYKSHDTLKTFLRGFLYKKIV